MKSLLLKLLPAPILAGLRNFKRSMYALMDRGKPNEEIFTQIYTNNEWGGAPGEFCSGGGSTEETIATRYLELLTNHPLSPALQDCHVVDLGCGDMRIGRHLIPLCKSFTGVDVVKPVIERNQAELGNANVRFEHLDIVQDELPDGDVCLIRQVLQHLSNKQVARILPKLKKYRHVIITEHLPSSASAWTPNLDKPAGKGIRLERDSGIDITAPPFSIQKSKVTIALEVPGNPHSGGGDHGVIRTILYTPNPIPAPTPSR